MNADFPDTLTTINKGTGAFNQVNVFATNAGSLLAIHGQGGVGSTDTIILGNNGNLSSIQGFVSINEQNGGLTNLVVDLSADGFAHTFDLSSDGVTDTLHDELGNTNDVTFPLASVASLTIDTDGSQDQTLNVDFGEGGNPIPTGATTGLVYNAGDPALSGASHALNLFGTLTYAGLPPGFPTGFQSEVHNANDQAVFPQVGQYGSISFVDGTCTAIRGFGA